MLGIVRVHQHARARQVKVVAGARARSAAPRRAASPARPRAPARVNGRTALVGARAAPRRAARRARRRARQAPVVRAHREVVEQAVDAGEVEVDHAARCARRRTARCRGTDRRAPGRAAGRGSGARAWNASSSSSSAAASRHRGTAAPRGREAPPLRPARILEVRGVRAAGEVHAREQRAELARTRLRRAARATRRAAASPAPPACRSARCRYWSRQVGDRRRARNAVAREVRHQVEIERQLVRRQALEQREHVAALRGGDEVVGVLDAGLDRLERIERADRVVARASARARPRRRGCRPTSQSKV